MSTKDLILAAAGDDTHIFSAKSIIYMPCLDSDGTMPRGYTSEVMRGSTSGNGSVRFDFSIETGEKAVREKFEWRKFSKGDETSAKKGGFRLVRLTSSPGGSYDGSSQASIGDGEIVAMLKWAFSWTNIKQAFSLELIGSGRSGRLGERWILMVVITALRIYTLYFTGKTSSASISLGEKVSGK